LKRSIIAIFIGLIILTGNVFAEGGSFGLGVIVGEPTGISAKKWTGNSNALDFAAAWSLDSETFHFHMDYLVHNFSLIQVDKGRLPLYYGIGGRIRLAEDNANDNSNNDDFIGIRIPVGLEYLFADAPLDIFLEIVPILDLVPETDFDFNAAIGVRYFF